MLNFPDVDDLLSDEARFFLRIQSTWTNSPTATLGNYVFLQNNSLTHIVLDETNQPARWQS